MARPRLAPAERRDVQLPPVRVTAAELDFIARQADAARLPLSDYARRRLLGQRVIPARSAADDRLVMELNRAGVNLNQIARAMNSDRPERIELADALADFRRVLALIMATHDDA